MIPPINPPSRLISQYQNAHRRPDIYISSLNGFSHHQRRPHNHRPPHHYRPPPIVDSRGVLDRFVVSHSGRPRRLRRIPDQTHFFLSVIGTCICLLDANLATPTFTQLRLDSEDLFFLHSSSRQCFAPRSGVYLPYYY